jgi:hypothetical protein
MRSRSRPGRRLRELVHGRRVVAEEQYFDIRCGARDSKTQMLQDCSTLSFELWEF